MSITNKELLLLKHMRNDQGSSVLLKLKWFDRLVDEVDSLQTENEKLKANPNKLYDDLRYQLLTTHENATKLLNHIESIMPSHKINILKNK